MDIAVLGIDLGKNSCSMVGLDGSGKVILRRRMQRKTIVAMAAKLSPCIIAMEACCGAHHLGRVLAAQGHTIRLMSPEYVFAVSRIGQYRGMDVVIPRLPVHSRQAYHGPGDQRRNGRDPTQAQRNQGPGMIAFEELRLGNNFGR